jgi:hypothetical protein
LSTFAVRIRAAFGNSSAARLLLCKEQNLQIDARRGADVAAQGQQILSTHTDIRE